MATVKGTETITVEEAAKLIGINRKGVYDAVKRGEIPSLRFGKRIVIPRAAFERMFDKSMPATLGVEPEPNLKRSKRGNFTLRLRDNLKARIHDAAEANGRSLSEEMEFRLELSVLR